MWFGSAGDGIYIYDDKPAGQGSFTNFTRRDGLCHNDILCCLEDKSGMIWFGTRNGIIRYTPSGLPPEKKDFTSFLISQNTINITTRKKIPYNFVVADNFVWSIMQDRSGKMYFGTNKGVYVHDPVKDISDGKPLFTHFLDNDNIVNSSDLHLKELTGMLQDKSGIIWFVSGYNQGEGICRYDGKTLTSFKPDNINSFRTAIERKSGNIIFLSSYHGIYTFDPKAYSESGFEKAFTNLTEKIGLQNDTLITTIEDKTGTLWFGTNSSNMKNGGEGGVWRYDGKSSTRLTTKDGLSHNCVFCIVEDRKGNIWFGTRNTGLCYFNGKKFTDFTE